MFARTLVVVLCMLASVAAWINPKIAMRPATLLRDRPVPMELIDQLDPSKSHKVTFIYNGEEKTVTVPETTNLLEAAEKIWKHLPNSCRNGVCISCAGKFKEGKDKVQLAIHGLGQNQIDAGYLCVCQAYPKADGAVIELDKYDECYELQYGQFEQSYNDFKYVDKNKREQPKKGFFNF